jgi:hypothetical protein
MSLLQAVENDLGSIDAWPSYIIQYLFIDTPTPQVVEELTAFFIGTCVPKTLAYRLHHACNPATTNELVRELYYKGYFIWQTFKTFRRMSRYYNVRMQKHVYLHVPYSTQLLTYKEIAKHITGMSAPALGIYNTSMPKLIRIILQRVRQELM